MTASSSESFSPKKKKNSSESRFNYAQNMILIFTSESYDFWSKKMKTLFISQDLWDLIKEVMKNLQVQKPCNRRQQQERRNISKPNKKMQGLYFSSSKG